ncbi:MAG: YitT family protein [Firmicutes bacterium]|nr:YitT family protein [Bacillota bacterium]
MQGIWQQTRRTLGILLGSFIISLAINGLFIPHHLLSGGVMGVALILNYLFGISTSLSILLLNLPIFLLGLKYVNRHFILLSLVGMLSLSVFLSLTSIWVFPVQDVLLAAIFGGALSGLGSGLVFNNRGSLGGTDIIAVVVNKYYSYSVGGVLLATNVLVILASAYLVDLQLALYTIISMYTSAGMVDLVQEGLNRRKTVFIISDQSTAIANAILTQLNRGVTYLQGEGAYSHSQKQILYCVVTTLQLARLKEIVREIDPQAFMSVTDTREVLGKGFHHRDFD